MRTTTLMSRPLTRGLAALAVGGTLVLAGCSSDSDEDSASEETSESAEPSEDAESPEADESEDAEGSDEATGVTYDLPEGWEDATDEVSEQAGQVGAEILSAARDASGGAAGDNVNVIQLPEAPGVDLDQIEQQALQQLEAAGLEDGETLERAELDGEEASRQTGVLAQGPAEARIDQFITLRGDQAYAVTFQHTGDTSDADRQADIDTVVDSIDFED